MIGMTKTNTTYLEAMNSRLIGDLPWFLTHSSPEELYTTGRFLVFDTETDAEENGSALYEPNDIVLACWQIVEPDGTVLKTAHKFGGIYEQNELLEDIKTVDFVVAQNLKFDIQWLKRCGADLHDFLGYDTMLAAWVLDGNKKNVRRNLGALAKRYRVKGKLDIVNKLIKLGVPTRDIHPRWLLEYCYQDVEATKNVFLGQQKELTARKVWHLVHTRNLACSVLADIEFAGMVLDPIAVEEEYNKAKKIMETIGAELAEITGGINLGSPKQLAKFIYDDLGMPEPKDYKGDVIRTDKGERTANSKALALLKPETDKQKIFLEKYKEYNKQASLVEKNLEYFKLTCEQRNCKFHGLFAQGRVASHRLASNGIPVKFEGKKKTSSVQLQNLPREYKCLFWSGDDDWYTFEADSAQLEFRVAVDLGKDKVGLEEIETGVDIHSFTAKVLTEEGEPTTRQEAKAKTFRPLFGGGSGSPALVAYCEYFKNKYEGISKTQREWAIQCADKKEFTTAYGITFYFPFAKMQRSGYITHSTEIYNIPIQGFATGEIIPIALVYYWHRAKGMPIEIFSTIHDSIVARVRKDYIETAKQIAQQALTTDVYEYLLRVYNYKFRVPLGLGMKHSRNWGTSKEEIKLDVWPDGRIEDRS